MLKISASPGAALAFAGLLCFLDTEALICLALSALCHEAGHIVALRLFGAPVCEMRLTALGLAAIFPAQRLSYGAEAVCAIAGPASGALLAFASASCGMTLLAGVSSLLTLFNLLPAYPLDGGRVLSAVLSYIFGGDAGFSAARAVGIIVSAGLIATGIIARSAAPAAVGAWLLYGYFRSSRRVRNEA